MNENSRKEYEKLKLEQAFTGLEHELPDAVCRALAWVRSPRSRLVRVPLALLCIGASFFWWLPVIGIEFLPIGLLLLAQDVPFLRAPVARFTLRLEAQWRRLKRWWQRRWPRTEPTAVRQWDLQAERRSQSPPDTRPDSVRR